MYCYIKGAIEKFINICYNNAIFSKCLREELYMGFPEEIKRIRQRCFLTQQDFAKEVQVAFSTVNRWEGGKTKPNLIAMKNIKGFCLKNDVDYSIIEEAWLDFEVRSKSK